MFFQVATGSGIGPCAPCILNRKVPIRLVELGQTRDRMLTYIYQPFVDIA